MSAIKCGACGHENDETRVFCQNCGGRLERTETAQTTPKITPVPVKRAAKRTGPSPLAAIGQFLKGVVAMAILGALIAVFVQFGRTPDGLPAPVVANDAAATQLWEGVKTFASSNFQRTLDVKEDQVNNYLSARIAAADSSGGAASAQFNRAFVVLADGTFRFYVERKYMGLSVYFWAEYQPLAGGEGATALLKGGGIGRMPIHPLIFPIVQSRVIAPIYTAMPDTMEVLGKANQVVIEPGLVRLGWAGKPAR